MQHFQTKINNNVIIPPFCLDYESDFSKNYCWRKKNNENKEAGQCQRPIIECKKCQIITKEAHKSVIFADFDYTKRNEKWRKNKNKVHNLDPFWNRQINLRFHISESEYSWNALGTCILTIVMKFFLLAPDPVTIVSKTLDRFERTPNN